MTDTPNPGAAVRMDMSSLTDALAWVVIVAFLWKMPARVIRSEVLTVKEPTTDVVRGDEVVA